MKKIDEVQNIFNLFNKEYKTAFHRPITYRFNEDAEITYKIDYDVSLFELGVAPVMNLMDFKIRLKKKGMDLYILGESATFDKETAMDVFEDVSNKARDIDEKNYPTTK